MVVAFGGVQWSGVRLRGPDDNTRVVRPPMVAVTGSGPKPVTNIRTPAPRGAGVAEAVTARCPSVTKMAGAASVMENGVSGPETRLDVIWIRAEPMEVAAGS
jgi:hypothetical protein